MGWQGYPVQESGRVRCPTEEQIRLYMCICRWRPEKAESQGRQTQRGHTGRSRVRRAFGHLWAQSTREISVSPGTSYLLRSGPWLFALLVRVSGSFARKMTAVGKELIFLRTPVQARAVLQIQLLNLAVSPPFLYFHSWVFSHTPEGKLKLRALLCMSEVCLHAHV